MLDRRDLLGSLGALAATGTPPAHPHPHRPAGPRPNRIAPSPRGRLVGPRVGKQVAYGQVGLLGI